MFNHFTVEGEVISRHEHVAPSGATKEVLTIELDTSFFDKKNQRDVEKVAEMQLLRYVRDNSIIDVGDYIIANGRINASNSSDGETTFLSFKIEGYHILK
jgi:hypothetical protein